MEELPLKAEAHVRLDLYKRISLCLCSALPPEPIVKNVMEHYSNNGSIEA